MSPIATNPEEPMLAQLIPETWKILRVLARSPKMTAVGKEMRVTPSRKTKDGTFLDALVKAGLIEVRGGPTAKTVDEDEPFQFRTHYRLTPLGADAAEYGEYQFDRPVPTDRPVKGPMAEVLRDRQKAAVA
jgi:hypothetical protein